MASQSATDQLPKGAFSNSMFLIVGAVPVMLDTTIINIAINHLTAVFNTNLATVQWAVTAYVLALGIAVPFAGWLLHRVNGKTLFQAAMIAFLLGSLLSGLSWNAGALIVFRILQGLASGVIMPTLSTLAVRIAGGSQNLGKLMSLVSIPVVFAPIVGPVVGGLILQYWSWHWLFFINLPIGAIGFILMQVKFPSFPADDTTAQLDWAGALLLAITSGTLIYGVTQVINADSRTVGIVCLCVGALALVAYVSSAFRLKAKATIPLAMFRSKNFSAAFVSLFLAGFATNGPMLLLPMLFQNVRHLSVIMAALWLVPQGIGMLITRPLIGKWTDKYGARIVVLPAILVTMIGTIPFVFFNSTTASWLVWLVLLIRGMGVGGFTVPVMADCYVGVEKLLVPAASVGTRMIQNIGSAFGSAVLATVVTATLTRHPLDLTGAYHASFITSLIFMVIGVFPALFLTNKLHQAQPALSGHNR